MKTIIAVTFIGIMTYALDENSSETELTECNKTAMENFDSEKYSNFLPAFVTHSKYKAGPTFCRISVSTSCDTVETEIYEYHQHSREKIDQYKILCSTSEEDYRKGQFWANCTIVKDTSLGNKLNPKPYKLYMSVVDTDYENYAIFYTCVKLKTGVDDAYEVLQKNPTTGEPELANRSLTKNRNEIKGPQSYKC
uniref:Putative triabin lipocalin n=1 Tax=Panstrongylus lignarius TaxID=156445 RepID=A0A224XXG8_9HEMI